MNIVLYGPIACQGAPALRAHFGDWASIVEVGPENGEALARAFAEADVLVSFEFDRSMPPAPRLKLLQLPASGLDAVDLAAVPPGCRVCNVFEHDIGISEYVLAAMLHFIVDLPGRDARFRDGSWADSPRAAAPFRPELAARTVGCVGYGTIGRAIARRARAFGMRVLAVTRTPRPLDPEPDFLGGFDELDRVLKASDFVVVACPLTDETHGLIGREALALMPQHAVLINVARGPLVDEDALFASLQGRAIGGAVIDTWYRYPSAGQPEIRPSRHPFHELDSVVMTPHLSGWTEGLMQRRFAVIIDNLERLRTSRPLLNQVHPQLTHDRVIV
jgi:phosphoglycerate dehydrogenase-like enzyme